MLPILTGLPAARAALKQFAPTVSMATTGTACKPVIRT